jgi:hypothetical protein
VDRAHDPIPLSVEGVEGVEGALPVEIVGTTGPIFEDGASELGLFQRRRLRKDLEEARCRQDSLGAFLDHLAFSAAGLRRDGFASAQYYDREGAGGDERYLFAPVGVERAREHLAALARELLVVRELLLPAMAVFAFKGGGERQPFAEIIGELIDNRCLASQYGPVRNAQDFHRPTDDEARSLLAPRLGLYFEMCEKVQDARGGQP